MGRSCKRTAPAPGQEPGGHPLGEGDCTPPTSTGANGWPVRQPGQQLFKVHGASDEVPLHPVAAEGADQLKILDGLDPFGHRRQAELARHPHAPFENRPSGRILASATDEAPVQLQLSERHAAELLERRVPDAEIIDREPEALQAEARQYIKRTGEVLAQSGLGDLEDDGLRRESDRKCPCPESVGGLISDPPICMFATGVA